MSERGGRKAAVGLAMLIFGLIIGVAVGVNIGRTPNASTTIVSTNSSDPVPTGGQCGVPSRCSIPFTVSYVHGRASMGTHGIAQVITFSNEKTGTLSSTVNYDISSRQYQRYFLYLPIGYEYHVIIFENTGSSQTRPSCNAAPFSFRPNGASDEVQDFTCEY